MSEREQMSDRQLAKARRQAERAHEKEQLALAREKRESWVKALEELPVTSLVKKTAELALPDSKKEALVEGGLILGTAAVTYAFTATLTPVILGAGAAIGSMAAYNIWRKNRGELQEITTRIFSYGKKMPEEA
jgi:hypothetical protein